MFGREVYMFGMLDYRAHKLYYLIVMLPMNVIVLISFFSAPIISYYISKTFLYEVYLQIIISVISLIIIVTVFSLINYLFGKFLERIFYLFIDIIPHDGRTKEEAAAVVTGGAEELLLQELSKHPSEWREGIEDDASKLDWVARLFYRKKIERRFRLIRHSFSEGIPFVPSVCDELLKEHHLEKGVIEDRVSNKWFRRGVFLYSFLSLLFIWSPF